MELQVRPDGNGYVWNLIYWTDRDNGRRGFGIGEVDAETGRIRYIDLRDGWLMKPHRGPLGAPRSAEEAQHRSPSFACLSFM